MLIEVEFRDGKRVNVLSMLANDSIKYSSLMLEEYNTRRLS